MWQTVLLICLSSSKLNAFTTNSRNHAAERRRAEQEIILHPAEFTYQWKLYWKTGSTFENAMSIARDAAESSLDKAIAEHDAEDMIIIDSFGSVDIGGCGIDAAFADFPECAIAETTLLARIFESGLSDQKIAEYILHGIQSYVPEFNNDLSKHKNAIRLSWEYPISIATTLLITLDGAVGTMNEVERVAFQLVLEEQIHPLMMANDPPFELGDVVTIIQQSSKSYDRRRLLSDNRNMAESSYNKIEMLVKANCGGSSCTGDNLEEFLLKEAEATVENEAFSMKIVEALALIQAAIGIRCEGDPNCDRDVVADISKEADAFGVRVIEYKVEELVLETILETSGIVLVDDKELEAAQGTFQRPLIEGNHSAKSDPKTRISRQVIKAMIRSGASTEELLSTVVELVAEAEAPFIESMTHNGSVEGALAESNSTTYDPIDINSTHFPSILYNSTGNETIPYNSSETESIQYHVGGNETGTTSSNWSVSEQMPSSASLLEESKAQLNSELSDKLVHEKAELLKEVRTDVEEIVKGAKRSGDGYFTQIDGVGMSDSKTGLLPPIELPPANEAIIISEKEERTVTPPIIKILALTNAVILILSVIIGCVLSPRKRKHYHNANGSSWHHLTLST